MKIIPETLQAKLDAGVTTLAQCWVVTRRDDVVMGFTDHDRDLICAGVTCLAASGFQTGEADVAVGLAAGLSSVSGALQSEAITAEDLDAGVYDGALVETYVADWATPEDHVRMGRHTISRITRTESGFVAELQGPMVALDKVTGRVFARGCDAALGDLRCGVDVSSGAYNAAAIVTRVLGPDRFEASGLDGFEAGRFRFGRLVWISGANVGSVARVAAHTRDQGRAIIGLGAVSVHDLAVGQGFEIQFGCDKQFTTCQNVFANSANFRGCPHMPGEDFILGYPRDGEVNDGGAR